MNVIDAVKNRRATKQFDADFKIPQEEKKPYLKMRYNIRQVHLICSIGVFWLLMMLSNVKH